MLHRGSFWGNYRNVLRRAIIGVVRSVLVVGGPKAWNMYTIGGQ